MADVFSAMRSDHGRLLELLDALRGDPAGPGPGAEQAKDLADQLVIEASRHEALEERVFWPVVRRSAGDGAELAALGLEQERTGKKLLNELDKTSAGTEEFRTLVLQVSSDVRRHVLYEETQVWPRAQGAISAEEAESLGARMEALRPGAPTRPHPLTPPDPRVLAAVGPIVGRLDQLRDAATGRGT